MGKFFCEVNYWIKSEESDYFDIEVMSTECTKVPSVGEVIYLNHELDKDWVDRNFGNENWMTEHKGFKRPPHLPDEEALVRGEYKVVSVNRFLRKTYHKGTLDDIFASMSETTNPGFSHINVPIATTREIFEVFLEPISKD